MSRLKGRIQLSAGSRAKLRWWLIWRIGKTRFNVLEFECEGHAREHCRALDLADATVTAADSRSSALEFFRYGNHGAGSGHV